MMPHTQTRYSLKWLIESANEKDDNERVWDRLADEIIDASNNEVSIFCFRVIERF